MPPHPAFATGDQRFNRRRFLKLGAIAGLSFLFPCPILASIGDRSKKDRCLSFFNTHTGESLKTLYWADGEYVPESLGDINHILRDHRTGEKRAIDTRLLDLLYAIGTKLKTNETFHVISGYRSFSTNEFLRKRGRRVARNSLHILGKAVDIRLPGRSLGKVREAAIELESGGVGYYPRTDFVHVDVGPVRFW